MGLSVCMYVCMYIYICVCVYVHVYIYTHIYSYQYMIRAKGVQIGTHSRRPGLLGRGELASAQLTWRQFRHSSRRRPPDKPGSSIPSQFNP